MAPKKSATANPGGTERDDEATRLSRENAELRAKLAAAETAATGQPATDVVRYPKMLYGPKGETCIVADEEAEGRKKQHKKWSDEPQVEPSAHRHIMGAVAP